jgi:hypothetical protein
MLLNVASRERYVPGEAGTGTLVTMPLPRGFHEMTGLYQIPFLQYPDRLNMSTLFFRRRKGDKYAGHTSSG